MDSSNSKLFMTYIIAVTTIMFSIGVIILPLISGTGKIIAGLVLAGGLIIFFILIVTIFEKYIKPVRSAAYVADQLVQGNYKARTYVSYHGEVGRLSNSINVLARSLQKMTLQEKIHDSQLRTVIDNMESGLMLIDEKGYVNLVNPKFLSMFGKSANKYVGYLYYNVLEQETIHKAVQEAFLYEEKVQEAFSIAMKIEERFIEVVGAPIFNDTNDLKGAVLVFHDITKLKRLEQTRKDFVANVSHELKTPITSIRGFAETLLDGAMNNEQLRQQFLKIILTESERLQTLVQDLLELSKLEKEDINIRLERINIGVLVDEIVAIISQQAKQKGIVLHTNFDRSIIIDGDPYLLKQLILNLLHNAINYTPQNGKVYLDVAAIQDQVIIKVSDTGIGISQEAQARIFERFYRVDKARSRDTGGTGLGLAIVKHIVEVHNGSIQVQSKLNQGSTFQVSLPKYSN